MLFSSISSFFLLFIMIFSGQSSPISPDYHFSRGKIERHVLESYLSRSITMAEFANSKGFYSDGPYPYKDDDIRMLKNIGAKFIGRSLYSWGSEQRFAEPAFWARANEFIARMHKSDPEMILQACIFEIVDRTSVG